PALTWRLHERDNLMSFSDRSTLHKRLKMRCADRENGISRNGRVVAQKASHSGRIIDAARHTAKTSQNTGVDTEVGKQAIEVRELKCAQAPFGDDVIFRLRRDFICDRGSRGSFHQDWI